MGKVKAKRRGLSESANQKKIIPKKKLNPFEIHVNRQKHNVVGRQLKSEKGRPGISRSKAMKKRKATLLQEYKVKDKSNKFFDRRIGEKNQAMTPEDRVIARFTAERMKMFKKKQIFNLADDEVLTHHGQTLSEIEKFDDPQSDEDDAEDSGKLEANFVGDAHFGGGMFKISEEGEKKSRKDLIDQLIAESKKRKAEKQRVRAQTIELTEKLDTEWQDLLPIVAESKRKPNECSEVEKPDSYDIAMRELTFERRARASDPSQTQIELEEQEMEKRAELQAERERRMKGDAFEKEQPLKHRSADDLDDGFVIEQEPEVFISYDSEGNILYDAGNSKMEEDIGESTEKSCTLNNDGNVDGDDVGEEEEEEEEDDDEDEDDEEIDDSLSDLKEDEGDDESDDPKDTKMLIPELELGNNDIPDNNSLQSNLSNPLSQKEKELLFRDMKRKSLNFSEIPEKYEDFEKIIENTCPDKQYVIICHMFEKNHVSLGSGNRARLERLFTFLLQLLHNCASQDPVVCFKLLNCLAPVLYDLSHLSPENASSCVLEVVKEKHQEFQNHQHKFPSINTVIFFKVISLLFPTSDFRHPVVTPSLVFMCQMLFQCRIKSRKDISMGLLIVTLLLEFTVLSKRFSPAAINFLCGILHLSIPKKEEYIKHKIDVPPFKKIGPYSDLLVLESKEENIDETKMKVSDLTDAEPIDTSFKIRTLASAVALLNEYVLNLDSISACPSIFSRVSTLLTYVSVDNYPQSVQEDINKLSKSLSHLKEKTLQYIIVERKRPKALRLYEPNIEKIFDLKRRRPMGKEKLVREKLLHKVKRERKAAVREIRRDNSFLAKLKWKETVQSDAERIKKVKEIFGDAANQLGEIRALERKKKHMN